MSEAPSIDGVLDDWGGSLTYVEDEPVAMSVTSTDSVLYVAVSVQDRQLVRSIVARGLIVWVDPAGGTKHTYGIRYPLGLAAQRAQETPSRESESSSKATGQQRSGLDRVSLSELDVLRHDSTRQRIPARFSSGLRANATLNPGALSYELAIPVGESASTNRAHGLRSALGSTVGVGLQTPDADDDDIQLPEGTQGMPSVTGRPGRGRTPRAGRRGRRRRQAPMPSKDAELPTLELWTKVVTRSGD